MTYISVNGLKAVTLSPGIVGMIDVNLPRTQYLKAAIGFAWVPLGSLGSPPGQRAVNQPQMCFWSRLA